MDHPIEVEVNWMRKYGKAYGVYTGLLPTLTLVDHEMIKQVLVRDFNHFIDRRYLNAYHEIWNLNLFSIEAEPWKKIRSIVTPNFTSGKLRSMHPQLMICAKKLLNTLDRELNKSSSNGKIKIYPRDFMYRYTIDVTSSVFFGMETDVNNEDAQSKSILIENSIKLTHFPPFRMAAALSLPRPILNLIGIKSFFPDEPLNYFIQLLKTVIKQRRSSGIKRNDFVQCLLESTLQSNDGNTLKLTENEIIAQCFVFFLGSYDSTANALTVTLFELARNESTQQRLFEEINSIVKETDNESQTSYIESILNRAPYLEAVIKEGMRKYPPEVRLERRVGSNNIKIGDIPMDKDILVEISVAGVHYCPEYYPEPERFDPERFMPENRDKLIPYTYLPFGQGLRNCVGSRFAYEMMKICLAAIIYLYQFSVCPETPDKLTFVKGMPVLITDHFLIKMSKRN